MPSNGLVWKPLTPFHPIDSHHLTHQDQINGHFRNLNWRYLPYIMPIFQTYVREYPHKIWPETWYSTSVLGSWNYHQDQDMARKNGGTNYPIPFPHPYPVSRHLRWNPSGQKSCDTWPCFLPTSTHYHMIVWGIVWLGKKIWMMKLE